MMSNEDFKLEFTRNLPNQNDKKISSAYKTFLL